MWLRDDEPSNESLQGNFQELLTFRIDSGDLPLKEHLENAPRNATCFENGGQRQWASLLQITCPVKQISILADEAVNVSYKENLSLVIRYTDATKTIREQFKGFYLCEEGTVGVATKDTTIMAVTHLGISMDDCRGQCYDNAGNMVES